MLKELGKRIVLLDGAMGTQLQARGLAPGELPETWNLTRPEDVQAIHEAYLAAGADVVTTNTFGANALKYGEDAAAVVRAGANVFVAGSALFWEEGRLINRCVVFGPDGQPAGAQEKICAMRYSRRLQHGKYDKKPADGSFAWDDYYA